MQERDIKLSDLHSDLTVAEIERYLDSYYPDTRINMQYDPIIKFKELPSELFNKILCSNEEIRASLPYINKDIHRNTLEVIYKEKCDELMKTNEIIKHLEEYKNTVVIRRFDLSATVLINPHSFNNYTNKINGDVYQIRRENSNGNKDIIIDFFKGNLDISHTPPPYIDMFSGYEIRKMRGLCMEYNSKYADESLISAYNKGIEILDLGKKLLHFKYIEYHFINNIVAHNINKDVKIMSGILNLNDQTSIRKFLLPYREESNAAIKNKIIELTGAKESVIPPYHLYIPHT